MREKGVKGKMNRNSTPCAPAASRLSRTLSFLSAYAEASADTVAPLRGARRAQYGKGKHILVLLAPPPLRAKQRKDSQKTNPLDSVSSLPPKNIDGGAPSSLAGAPRVALANVFAF